MRLTALVFCLIAHCAPATADEPQFSPEHLEFFETRVRPLLAARCYECHSASAETVRGGLKLDGRAVALEGGDSGPAVVPQKPDESLLIDAVKWTSYEMPPDGKLKPAQIATLERWIELGAPWPDEAASPVPMRSTQPTQPTQPPQPTTYEWRELRNAHWAYRPIGNPQPPPVQRQSWPQSGLDHFVLARLEAAGLAPMAAAEPRTLLRRMYFDLIGLPPDPRAVTEFLGAWEQNRSDAVAMAVDELLASPQYGERWGRHWLDVARYSDGLGGFLDNAALPQAWRYRDWVVTAFNEDTPFDRFLELQIAGDIIEGPEGAVATGFFALGPTYRSDGGDPDSVAQAEGETLDDRVDTLSRGLLGLTVSCARCHAHKFDPIPQEDYYSLAGIFRNCRVAETSLAPSERVADYEEHQRRIQELDKQLRQFRAALKKEKRAPTGEEQEQLQKWESELEELKQTAPARPPYVHALVDHASQDMPLAIRGNLRKPGDVVPRRFLRILTGPDAPAFQQGSGRRELAAAVSSDENPLTARVFVNRVWLHHFGEALVRTPSNFGTLGEPPTHPLLLDWLARRFIDSGWSVKQLHRTIMLSATYQQSSQYDADCHRRDGDNRLIWRMNPRRLDVEAWRDSLLHVCGELDLTPGGPPVARLDSARRTLYFEVSRNGDRFESDRFLRLFDFPLMRATVARRPSSTVPQQYLFLLNSDFMIARARAFVARVSAEAPGDAKRIERAYQLLFSREPLPEERELGLGFLESERQIVSPLTPWQRYAQVLLASNEFMYVR